MKRHTILLSAMLAATSLCSAFVHANSAETNNLLAVPMASDETAAAAAVAPVHSEKACMLATDQASALDLKAATAQAERKALADIVELYKQAVTSWSNAVAGCQGRSQDRAKRNLATSEKILGSVLELQGSGPQCESTQKDAVALNSLAKQAADEKRYGDASALYRKAADLWDVATERCSGSQYEIAVTRRGQSETDSYNAEFCAPVYVKARDQTQRLKTMAGSLTAAEKQDLSRTAEKSWREAAMKCKGPAVDMAVNNAQSLAKERGSPLPNTAVSSAAEPAKSAQPRAQTRSTATPGVTQPSAIAQEIDVTTGTTRFAGKFTLDPNGKSYSGSGRVSWTNGEAYEGTLVLGQREGQGKFVWSNGQTYEGEWRNDAPNGQGVMKFANGNLYEGSVVAGIPNGNGKMAYANGDSYSGEMVKGIPSGRGTFLWKGGDRYSGQWKAGQKEGSGVFTWRNGDRWEGVYRDDQQTDAGTLIRHNEQQTSVAGSTSPALAR
jgi:hypothetical protein